MTVEEAYSKFKKEYSDLVILSCHEYESRFVFYAVPSEYAGTDKQNKVFDSLYSVQKKDGTMSLFTPFDISEEEYDNGKKIPAEKFDVKIKDLQVFNREAVNKWLDGIDSSKMEVSL